LMTLPSGQCLSLISSARTFAAGSATISSTPTARPP
jgi:hypothetical protein